MALALLEQHHLSLPCLAPSVCQRRNTVEIGVTIDLESTGRRRALLQLAWRQLSTFPCARSVANSSTYLWVLHALFCPLIFVCFNRTNLDGGKDRRDWPRLETCVQLSQSFWVMPRKFSQEELRLKQNKICHKSSCSAAGDIVLCWLDKATFFQVRMCVLVGHIYQIIADIGCPLHGAKIHIAAEALLLNHGYSGYMDMLCSLQVGSISSKPIMPTFFKAIMNVWVLLH